jgi:hypothetical protein
MKKILTIILVCNLILTSCSEEWLNLNPHTSVSDETAITNLDDAQAALYGVYYHIRTSTFYGRDAIICGDAGTPDVVLKTTNSNRFVVEYSWQNVQPGGSFFTNIYIRGYRAIDAVNKLIQKVESMEIPEDDKNTANQILGESYFLRSLIHFEILKYFAQAYNFNTDGSHLGIVYMFEPTQSNNHARLTVKESFEHVIADAKKAYDLMLDPPADKKINPFTAEKMAAHALLARVYLYKACISGTEDFTEAGKYAESVINSNLYRLATPEEYSISGTFESFNSNMWLPAGGYSPESILVLPFTEAESNATDALSGMYLDPKKGYADLIPSNEIVSLIGTISTDVRRTIFYEDELSATSIICLRKFFGGNQKWDLAHINVFRISEMYLIAAEAAARQGGSTNEINALQYLNLLKTNRNVPTVSGLAGQPLIEEILLERRKELCFEGHRLADLKRLNIGVIRGNDTNNPGNDGYDVPYPDYRFAFPIPQAEIDVNGDIIQNDDYY